MSTPVVLITGALTGIGRAAALAFAAEGSRIVVSGRHEEAGQALATELRALGAEADFVRADVRHDDEVRELIDRTTKEADDIDARIIEVSAMEEKGFWECENGHEVQLIQSRVPESTDSCPECMKPLKLVSRATMTPKEQYESDKESKEAEQNRRGSHSGQQVGVPP